MKKKLKENKGITLVALIITVILMLILAGVAISVLIGDGGLFDKTRNAALAYEESAQNEADEMQKWMNEIDEYLSGSYVQKPTVATLEVSDITQNSFTLVAIGKDETAIEKYELYINGVLEKTEETSAETVTFNVTEKTTSTEYKCKVKVYNTLGKFKESDEIIVNTVEFPSLIIGQVNNNQNQTYNGEETGTYDNPIVPKGFAPINENNAIWGTENGWEYGLVIQDGNENQFVWVPVNDTVTFERKEWNKGFVPMSSCTDNIPTLITTSINTNEGFYIARYEAGKSGTTVVSKKDAIVWNDINWSTAKLKAEGMYESTNTNYGATSTLIYGTQWDTTLKFIEAYGDKDASYPIDSTGKGNHNGISGGDTTTDMPATCGLLEAFRKNNIYDMAGNVREWTMEVYNDTHLIRGGNCESLGINNPPSVRDNTHTGDEGTFMYRRI